MLGPGKLFDQLAFSTFLFDRSDGWLSERDRGSLSVGEWYGTVWKKAREKGEERQRELADSSISRLKGQISPRALSYFYTGDPRRLQLSTHCALFSKFAAVHFDQVSAAYWIRGVARRVSALPARFAVASPSGGIKFHPLCPFSLGREAGIKRRPAAVDDSSIS